MHPFRYHRPATLAAAQSLIAELDDAKLLAGGMTLLPTMKMRLAAPSAVIDLGRIDELRGVRETAGGIEIAAMTTHAEVAGSALIREAMPALCRLAGNIGDPQVRNRGTLGGSVANSDPAADYPAAVLAMNAVIVTNRREIAADDFFIDLFETALDDGELITALRFPRPRRAAYASFRNPASHYAIAGVMVCDGEDGIRVAVTGAAACAYRASAMEQALRQQLDPAVIDGVDIDAAHFNDDIHASQAYRAQLVRVMAQRAVTAVVAGSLSA